MKRDMLLRLFVTTALIAVVLGALLDRWFGENDDSLNTDVRQTPADSSAGVNNIDPWWEISLEFLVNHLFLGLVILAIITFVGGAAYGAFLILKDGTSVWPKRFFYTTMILAFAAAGVFLFQRYIGPEATRGLGILVEHTRQDIARPFVEVAQAEGVPENWSQQDLAWMDIVIPGLILIVVAWMLWPEKKESKK